MDVKRGDVVAYWKQPTIPLKVISNPYNYAGAQVVTARRVSRKKADRQQGMYLVSALVPYDKQEVDNAEKEATRRPG